MTTSICKQCGETYPLLGHSWFEWCPSCRALANGRGILAGTAIARAVQLREIEIDPFDAAQVNPMSYDLRLGDAACFYTACAGRVLRKEGPSDGEEITPGIGALDAAKANEVEHVVMSKNGFLLRPNIGYLLHTLERIRTDKYQPIVDGKSSIGRLFISVHETAGYGDPGFDGQYTLEVAVVHPVIVYPGMRFAQMRFHTIVGTPTLYAGNYVGATSKGPVASRSWKQFEPSAKARCAAGGCGGFARPEMGSKFCSKACRESSADGTC